MNAQEAKVITAASKKPFDELMNTVKAMAESGHNYASFEPNRVADPEETKSRFEELGYTVTINEYQFKIHW